VCGADRVRGAAVFLSFADTQQLTQLGRAATFTYSCFMLDLFIATSNAVAADPRRLPRQLLSFFRTRRRRFFLLIRYAAQIVFCVMLGTCYTALGNLFHCSCIYLYIYIYILGRLDSLIGRLDPAFKFLIALNALPRCEQT